MKKRIVIICSAYPFVENETFLINEISYLKDEFEEVVLFPLDVIQSDNTCLDFQVLQILQSKVSFYEIVSAIFSFTVLRELISILFSFDSIILRSKIALMSWIKASKIVKILSSKTENPNTIFYSYWGMDGAVALSILKKKYINLKVACRFHGWDVFKQANAINYLPFRSFIASNIPNLIPISNAGKAEIEMWHPKARPKVFYLGSENQEELMNFSSSELVVLTLSNFNLVKRMPLFFEVMSKLKIKLRWIHIGAGESAGLIVQNGKEILPENVSFEWKGSLSHEEVLFFLSKQPISCLINLSSSEGIPVSMMEAMSFGIPVFATNVGGVSEIIDDSCGVLIDKNLSSLEISSRLENFLLSDLTSYRLKAREKWENTFNARINFTLFTNYLKELIE